MKTCKNCKFWILSDKNIKCCMNTENDNLYSTKNKRCSSYAVDETAKKERDMNILLNNNAYNIPTKSLTNWVTEARVYYKNPRTVTDEMLLAYIRHQCGGKLKYDDIQNIIKTIEIKQFYKTELNKMILEKYPLFKKRGQE